MSCIVSVEKPWPRRPERRFASAARGMLHGSIPMCFQKSSSSTATIALRSTGGMSRNATTTRFSIANSPITLPSLAKTCVMMFGWKSSSDVTCGRSLSKARKTPSSAPPMTAAAKSAVTTTRRRVRTRGGAAGGAIKNDYDAPESRGPAGRDPACSLAVARRPWRRALAAARVLAAARALLAAARALLLAARAPARCSSAARHWGARPSRSATGGSSTRRAALRGSEREACGRDELLSSRRGEDER